MQASSRHRHARFVAISGIVPSRLLQRMTDHARVPDIQSGHRIHWHVYKVK